MKHIISTMCMAAVILLSTSCNKDGETVELANNDKDGETVERASNKRATFTGIAENISGGTKAHNAYSYEVLWDGGEKIFVTDNGGHDNTFTLTSGENTSVGTFSEDEIQPNSYAGFISGDTVEAFYPASLKTDTGYVWPATQSNNQVAPMYAKQAIMGTGNEVVSFSSLGAMLQIVFSTKTEDATVTSITLKHSAKPLSGKFTVYEDGQAIMAENSNNPGVTLDLGEDGVPVGVAATYFYLNIPAGIYSTAEKDQEMTITFTDEINHEKCVMTFNSFPEVERNTVGRITIAKDFTQHCTVKFNMKGHGEAIQDTIVEYGTTVKAPATPTAATNVEFIGWCTDEACKTPYDFTQSVTADITLYAKWADALNGHAYVELAGYKWATKNVGYCENVTAAAGPGTDGNDWGLYYYTQENAKKAAESWGGETINNAPYSWTLPSATQWQALIDNCYWEWTNEYDNPFSPYNCMSGCIVYKARSGDEGHYNIRYSGYSPATEPHIFLPAGNYYETDYYNGLYYQGDYGFFWSADDEFVLFIDDSYQFMSVNYFLSIHGTSVRPVFVSLESLE